MAVAGLTRDNTLGWLSRPTQLMKAGFLLTAAVLVAQAVSQWIDFRFFHLTLTALDSDHHASVFGAVSILAEVLAAAAVAMRAAPRWRPAWLLVAVLVGLPTVPRALMRYVPAFERYDVLILVVPLTVVFVLLCALTFRDGRRVKFMLWGSLVLLACSFALHAVGPQADARGETYVETGTWTYQVTGMLKHGAELGGWMLLATGMAVGSLAFQGGRTAHRQRYRRAPQTRPADGRLDRQWAPPHDPHRQADADQVG